MGTRYYLDVTCPECGVTPPGNDAMTGTNAYYAPTCGFTDWTCPECGHVVDLAEYTGISYEDASNRKEIEQLVESFAAARPSGRGEE